MSTTCSGYCAQKHNELDMIPFNGSMYCYECFIKVKQESIEYSALINYIHHVFKTYPTKMMLNQIDKYHSKNKWSYKNIRLALEYAVEIKGMQMDFKYGIGIVPHVYDDMIMYHKARIKKAKETESKAKVSKRIKVNKKRDSIHKFNKSLLIDIEGIDD